MNLQSFSIKNQNRFNVANRRSQRTLEKETTSPNFVSKLANISLNWRWLRANKFDSLNTSLIPPSNKEFTAKILLMNNQCLISALLQLIQDFCETLCLPIIKGAPSVGIPNNLDWSNS